GSTSMNRAKGRNHHPSIHTAASAMASILARPDSANLGPDLIVPAVGFETTIFGTGTGGQDSAAIGTPTPAQFAVFFSALDSLDVLWLPNFAVIGSSVTDSIQRRRLESFIRTKGFVSSHNTLYSEGIWPAWDSIHGARLENWISTERLATLHL